MIQTKSTVPGMWGVALVVVAGSVGIASAVGPGPGLSVGDFSPPVPLYDAEADADAPEFDAAKLSFFEERVRPVLAEHCYACHSHEARRVRGGIYLDSREGFLEAAVAEPGEVEHSHLLEAIGYEDPLAQMPPDGKLSDADIEALTRWVEMGMPWPDEDGPAGAEVFDLDDRRATHWCWQPPVDAAPPTVRDEVWVRNDIDRFVLARLEAEGLTPSPEADKVTLIRRLTFDLIGLPPTPQEVDAFVNDDSADAYEKLADRLLASPHFGEKWGRHWLDLVRYAESYGHEFDFNVHEPWRYRDYVVKAFNDDVPHDRLLFEHLAGDLIEAPRRDEATGMNLSVQGTGWYWLGEQTHSPVDSKGHQSDYLANQIDVIGRGFQGITIACARCHDHKFDAISTQDYYSIYGSLESTSWTPAALDPPERLMVNAEALRSHPQDLARALREHWVAQEAKPARYMTAAAEIFSQTRALEGAPRSQRIEALCDEVAQRDTLDRSMLRRWVGFTFDGGLGDGQHPMHGWRITVHSKPQDMRNWWAHHPGRSRTLFENGMALRGGDVLQWQAGDEGIAHGLAFGGDAQVLPGDLLVAAGRGQGVGQLAVFAGMSSSTVASRWQGVFQTTAQPIEKRYLHVLAQGRGAFLNFVIDGFRVIRAPIYGPMRQAVNAAYPRWYSVDLDKWQDDDHVLYVEMSDTTAHPPGGGGSPADAHGTIYRVVASDQGTPPAPGYSVAGLVDVPADPSVAQVASAYEALIREAVAFWQSRGEPQTPADYGRLSLLSALLDAGLIALPAVANNTGDDPAALLASYRAAAGQVPVPRMGLAAAESTPMDSPIFVRGSHLVPGDPAPRRYLEAIVGDEVQSPEQGSGRLDIARVVTDPGNPLTARVAVNRLWHHLFGRGIVASVDNMGVLGTPPTHPELLDALAITFMADDDWSTKAMIKRIVMSATYRQQSDTRDASTAQADPNNLLLHRQNLRRLPAESIRDAILHTSGRLDPQMFGPSVMVHLTAFMEGRGRPGNSGPLDGAGRRSIYTGVRRNFLSPMMLAFDVPSPFATVGRRNVTNVPAQALFLMNDPFVHQQTEVWAQSLLEQGDATPQARIDRMWRTALGRAPAESESAAALAYLQSQAESYGLSAESLMTDMRPWRDLGHAVFNTKSFLFIR